MTALRLLPRSLPSSSKHIIPSLARTYSTIPQPPSPLPTQQPTSSSPSDVQQSPNVPTTWSTSQNPKPHAYNNARFEQTRLDMQPNAPSAMGMVAEDPIRLVDGRRATCDGGEWSFQLDVYTRVPSFWAAGE